MLTFFYKNDFQSSFIQKSLKNLNLEIVITVFIVFK